MHVDRASKSVYLGSSPSHKSVLIDCTVGQCDVNKLTAWTHDKRAFILREDSGINIDADIVSVAGALTALHDASAFPGVARELVTHTLDNPLLPVLGLLADQGLATRKQETEERISWSLTEEGCSASEPVRHVAQHTKAMKVRVGDVPLNERTTWELMEILESAGWEHNVWRPHKEKGKWVRPPAYECSKKSKENKRWFTLASARSASWNYLLTLAMCDAGELTLAEPLEHLLAAGIYAKVIETGAVPGQKSKDATAAQLEIDLSFSENASGLCDVPESAMPGRITFFIQGEGLLPELSAPPAGPPHPTLGLQLGPHPWPRPPAEAGARSRCTEQAQGRHGAGREQAQSRQEQAGSKQAQSRQEQSEQAGSSSFLPMNGPASYRKRSSRKTRRG